MRRFIAAGSPHAGSSDLENLLRLGKVAVSRRVAAGIEAGYLVGRAIRSRANFDTSIRSVTSGCGSSITHHYVAEDEHFGGVLHPLFTISLDRNWTSEPYVWEMLTVDQGSRSALEFRTTVELTGDTVAHLPPSAFYRLACLYVLARLDAQSVQEACQTLSEIYECQVEKTNYSPDATHVQRVPLGSSGAREVKRQPFVITE